MQPSIQSRLLALNRSFYEQVATAFDGTRSRPWPGFGVVAEYLLPKCIVPWRILDVGCGNGRLLHYLSEKKLVQEYWGIDANETLLSKARLKAKESVSTRYVSRHLQIDITVPDWTTNLERAYGFDVIYCLATLHHLPGVALRSSALQQMANLLRPGGYLVLSNWQPLNSNREQKKILDWAACRIDREEVEEGDLLISWKHQVQAARYVHVFSSQEVCQLAETVGLTVKHQFLSDGSESNLNLYSILCRST